MYTIYEYKVWRNRKPIKCERALLMNNLKANYMVMCCIFFWDLWNIDFNLNHLLREISHLNHLIRHFWCREECRRGKNFHRTTLTVFGRNKNPTYYLAADGPFVCWYGPRIVRPQWWCGGECLLCGIRWDNMSKLQPCVRDFAYGIWWWDTVWCCVMGFRVWETRLQRSRVLISWETIESCLRFQNKNMKIKLKIRTKLIQLLRGQ